MLLISRAFRRGKLLEFWQNASEVIPKFHEYTIWLPFNIMGDKLRSQSWVFVLFLVPRTPRIEKFKACIFAYC